MVNEGVAILTSDDDKKITLGLHMRTFSGVVNCSRGRETLLIVYRYNSRLAIAIEGVVIC